MNANRSRRRTVDAGSGANGSAGSESSELRVLAVDDQPANLYLIRAMLSGLPVEIIHARSGKEALEKARENDFVLVLMDIRMPGMSGVDAAKQMRKLPRHANTPIIFITAYAPEEQELLGGYEAGSLDYLFKPVMPQILRAKVTAFADLFRKNEELRRKQAIEAVNRELQHSVDALEQAHAKLEQAAHYDALTGLANRTLFLARLEQEIAACQRHGNKLALMLVDLDRFKEVNDTLGHEAGDMLLREAAARLQQSVRANDTVGRLGGDEFVVLLSDLADSGTAADMAEKILERLAAPMVIDTAEVFVSGSIGVAICPDDETSCPGLLRNADMALYTAKEQGRDAFRFFTEQMNRRAHQRVETEAALRQALIDGEFELAYQPRVGLRAGHIVGVEALLRWRRNGALVSASEFVPLADETGLIVSIGEWALRSVCRQIRAWHDEGVPRLQVAMNLSARQFKSDRLIATVEAILGETNAPADWLELEITENIAMHYGDRTAERLHKLHAMGLHIALDDFGAGCSSLHQLAELPLDGLTISGTFVRGMQANDRDRALIRAIIAMGRNLGLATIAAGVETSEQVALLHAEQCDGIQGNLVSPPTSAAEVARLLIAERHMAHDELPWGGLDILARSQQSGSL